MICVRGGGDRATGCELQFEPARQRAQFAAVAGGRMGEEAGNWRTIDGLTGLDQPFTLDVLVKHDLVEAAWTSGASSHGIRTGLTGDRVFFTVHRGAVTLTDVRIRPLVNAEFGSHGPIAPASEVS